MDEFDVFHFEEEKENFEDFALENGGRYWFASDLMRMFGYETLPSFNKAINRAISACMALNIPVSENFIQVKRVVDGKPIFDHKLTRFACYLTAMNADARKPQVASAQFYFATLAEAFQQYVQEAQAVERVAIREDITEHEKSLSGLAMRAGVQEYGLFQNAGYRGMYNMNLSQLRVYKGLTSTRTLLDFMGKTELAANLFRITQTEEKIKNENILGQRRLESAAHQVGREVRNTMIRISGTAPENLPLEEDIKEVKKELKSAHRGFKKLDSGERKKLNP